MKVVSIEYPTPLEQRGCDNIDVFVRLENGRSYCVTVTDLDWIAKNIEETGKGYLPPKAPDIIVKKLDHDIIEAAVREYAKGDGYYLRLMSVSHGDKIPELSYLKEITETAFNLDIFILRYGEMKSEDIFCRLVKKYAEGGTLKNGFFWENLADHSYIADPLGWRYIKDFAGNRECILLFDDCDGWQAVLLKSGDDLNTLLEETGSYEIYVTDKELSYLICFCHEDVLYCCGEAKGLSDSISDNKDI